MIRITADPLRPRLTARFRPFLKILTRKIGWGLPDRKDTATGAYVTVRRYLAKAEAEEGPFEIWMSNDNGRALQYEIRRYQRKAPPEAVPTELTRILVLLDEGFEEQEKRIDEEQRAEREAATRRGATSVRERRGLR